MLIRNNFLCVLLLSSFFSSGLYAEEQWNFRLSPYIWFAGSKGDVGPLKNLPPVDIDISPSDALSDTESSFMLIFDAKKGRHGIHTDTFYSDVQQKENVINETSIESTTKTTMITSAYTYEIFSDNNTVVDLMAGVRLWHIDATLKLRSPTPILNQQGDNTESWVDPFIGIKARAPLGESKFFVSGGIAYGGFDVNAKSFYDVSANLGYRWSDSISTLVGYRQYKLDYDQNDFLYDVKNYGWQVGLTWGF